MDWLTSVVSNLKGKSAPIVCLMLGSVVAVIAVSGTPVTPQTTFHENDTLGRVFLGFLAFLLLSVGLWLTIGTDTSERQGKNQNRRINKLEGDLRLQKEKFFSLSQNVSRAVEVLNRSPKDPVKLEALQILEGISQDFTDFTLMQVHRREAAEWISQRIERWINLLQIEDYRDDGINSSNIGRLRSELSSHLELLCENILFDENASPQRANPPLTQSVGNSITYKKAFQFLETKIIEELDDNSDFLHRNSVREIKKHVNNFVELSTM